MRSLLLTTLMTGIATFSVYGNDAQAKSPLKNYQDGSYITLQGKVQNVSDDEFVLMVGNEKVDVDFNEWDLTNNVDLRNYLTNGETVYISGKVDKDLFSDNEVEADNIYFSKTYDYYYVTDYNPAYTAYYSNAGTALDGTFISTRGTVTSKDGDEFLIDAKGREIQIDTSELNNEMTDVDVGDRIYVYGEVDYDLFERREIMADSIVKINKAS